jgi:hypothetical protein
VLASVVLDLFPLPGEGLVVIDQKSYSVADGSCERFDSVESTADSFGYKGGTTPQQTFGTL